MKELPSFSELCRLANSDDGEHCPRFLTSKDSNGRATPERVLYELFVHLINKRDKTFLMHPKEKTTCVTTYRVKKDAICFKCQRPDVTCRRHLRGIPEEVVYLSLGNARHFVFLSDGDDCSQVAGVEVETFARLVEDMCEIYNPLASKVI